MNAVLPLLDLGLLGQAQGPGVSEVKGRELAEAAAFCLSTSGHVQGVNLRVVGVQVGEYQVTWRKLPDNVAAARNDLQEATEDGAMGLAILLVRTHMRYEIMLRARKGLGYDYHIRKLGSDPRCPLTRLEISGILKGSTGDVTRRVNEKVRQVNAGASSGDDSPAFVIVIEFSRPIARIEAT